MHGIRVHSTEWLLYQAVTLEWWSSVFATAPIPGTNPRIVRSTGVGTIHHLSPRTNSATTPTAESILIIRGREV